MCASVREHSAGMQRQNGVQVCGDRDDMSKELSVLQKEVNPAPHMDASRVFCTCLSHTPFALHDTYLVVASVFSMYSKHHGGHTLWGGTHHGGAHTMGGGKPPGGGPTQ